MTHGTDTLPPSAQLEVITSAICINYDTSATKILRRDSHFHPGRPGRPDANCSFKFNWTPEHRHSALRAPMLWAVAFCLGIPVALHLTNSTCLVSLYLPQGMRLLPQDVGSHLASY